MCISPSLLVWFSLSLWPLSAQYSLAKEHIVEDLAVTAGQLLRWSHVLFSTLWIGLLYYFNFVQIPTMPKVPAELKPGVSKYIAPQALFYFRWSALFTVIIGLILSIQAGYGHAALMLGIGGGSPQITMIGIGMWLGIIMFLNVWLVIWPNQKKALGIVEADADTKAKAARTAMLVSRTNFMLSFPMMYCMVVFGGLSS
jgi:uncharacterized membrane protein